MLALLALFTILTVATSAYEFQQEYTSDPAVEEAAKQWFQRSPFSLISSMGTKCQDAQLAVGGHFMTTNKVFLYTLDRLWQGDGVNRTIVSQVPYRNTTLRDCNVREITIDLNRIGEVKISRNHVWEASKAGAITTCTIDTPIGLMQANFTVELPELTGYEQASSILSPRLAENAAAYYGLSITKQWYAQLPLAIQWEAYRLKESPSSGTFFRLSRNHNVTNYRSPDYLLAFARAPTSAGNVHYMLDTPMSQWDPLLPRINITIAAFGKAFLSLLEADFGMGNLNPLRSKQGLDYLYSINDTVAYNSSKAKWANNTHGRAGLISHASIKDNVDLNSTVPTTIFAQYLCFVPMPKNWFAITYAVVLANLVFIKSCWLLFLLGAKWGLSRKDKTIDNCGRCAPENKTKDEEEQRLLADTQDATTTSSPSSASRRKA
ncbi:hypothetical protein AMS68_007237 [Peltaster fructicola]|uniref:Transmembrane protein n=1 Tax=Peltaster fructicola TaxID=286661 RepID=A0A6H0Y533_9PEZI|nr:hypothetical protein AMS68_007237 [Peltaster fructicola]